jgi:hypothetical protein
MRYAILCYHSEAVVSRWGKEKDDAVVEKLNGVTRRLAAEGRLGPVGRLAPTRSARTVRKEKEPIVTDGPFAETKEQLLGFFIVECASHAQAVSAAEELARATGDVGGAYEVRELTHFEPGGS